MSIKTVNNPILVAIQRSEYATAAHILRNGMRYGPLTRTNWRTQIMEPFADVDTKTRQIVRFY